MTSAGVRRRHETISPADDDTAFIIGAGVAWRIAELDFDFVLLSVAFTFSYVVKNAPAVPEGRLSVPGHSVDD